MAQDNTVLLLILGFGGLYLISKSQTAAAQQQGLPAGSGSASRAGGGGGGGSPASGSNPTGPTGGSAYAQGPPAPATDPCNQSSPSFDAALCAASGRSQYTMDNGVVTTPTTTDSGDPCDTTSVNYDPGICSENGGTVYTPAAAASTGTSDSGDPCDPSSVAYDPGVCSETGDDGGSEDL